MVARHLGRLAPGPARDRLTRISGLARILDGRFRELEDDQVKHDLRILVESAGPVAEELARLDELEHLLSESGLNDDPEGDARAKQVEARRAQLTTALESAAHILERAAQGKGEVLGSAAELPALAQAIETRIEAWDEVLSVVEARQG